MNNQTAWLEAKNRLVKAVSALGFAPEFGVLGYGLLSRLAILFLGLLLLFGVFFDGCLVNVYSCLVFVDSVFACADVRFQVVDTCVQSYNFVFEVLNFEWQFATLGLDAVNFRQGLL